MERSAASVFSPFRAPAPRFWLCRHEAEAQGFMTRATLLVNTQPNPSSWLGPQTPGTSKRDEQEAGPCD